LRQKYVLAHAKALDYLIGQEGFNVVFLPSNLRSEIGCNDLDISRMIIQNMLYGGRVKIVNVSDAREFRAVLKQLDLLISTRMHPTILASLENVPFVSIIYDHKQLGFLDQIGLESCGINVDEISCEKLLSKFRFVLSNKDKIKKQMNSRVLILRKDIRNKTEKCVLTLLRRKSARSSISRRFRD
jgi:polysaccharide pyruvyl transferase WcaK-like protein